MNGAILLSDVRQSVTDARIAELTRQRNALQAELDSIANHDRPALAKLQLFTGRDMTSHAIKAGQRMRAAMSEQATADVVP